MIPVERSGFVLERADAVKAASRSMVTNLYASQEALESWIRAGSLFHEAIGETSFFFRKDADFFHLLYVSPSGDVLAQDLKEISSRAEILTADVVTKATGTEAVLGLFEGGGFHLSTTLVRMCRTGNPGGEDQGVVDEVRFARADEAGRLHEVLNRHFDRYAEQIPSPAEIAADIGRERFLLIDQEGIVAGLVHFEIAGLTSHLRRWFVNPARRGRNVGSRLLRRYFTLSGRATRFILWVLEGNGNAIDRYQHYGYRVDDLVDTIFINKERLRHGS